MAPREALRRRARTSIHSLAFSLTDKEVGGLTGDNLRVGFRPLGIPADVLVVSQPKFDRWSGMPGTVYYWAAREGRVFDVPA